METLRSRATGTWSPCMLAHYFGHVLLHTQFQKFSLAAWVRHESKNFKTWAMCSDRRNVACTKFDLLFFREENRSKARIDTRNSAHCGLLVAWLSVAGDALVLSFTRLRTVNNPMQISLSCSNWKVSTKYELHAQPSVTASDSAWRKGGLLVDCLLIASFFLVE
jgi:hypothetical protein